MHYTNNAGFLSGNRQGCLRGTRRGVLQEIECWLTSNQGSCIYWLNGLAGTGKSTIAQTFAETSFAYGNLGASFFCSRDFENRSNLQAIFPTLAFQLAFRYPSFRKQVLQILKASPNIGRESLCSQMEKLIVGPLKAARISTLIIIDALDECKDQEPASAVLSILSRYVNEIPNVKFFITGRPEPQILSGFRLRSRLVAKVVTLHSLELRVVDNDIKLFYQTQLASLAKTRSDCDFREDWPSSNDIKILCMQAGGLFIYASIVVKFVASEYHPPQERLASIITSPPQCTVDQLYTSILQGAFHNVDADDSQRYICFRAVVGAVLLIFNPLSIKSLSELLRFHPSYIRATMRPLHSLFLISDSTDDPIHTFHKSFLDFITDPVRCKDELFFVEPTVHHKEILLSCLHLMGKRLKKNICNLDDHVVLSEVEDISACWRDHIGDALEYACHFWAKHLMEIPSSGPHVEEVQTAIDKFFTSCLLFWIEVLSLMKNLNVGIYALNDIQRWYTSVSCV